MPAAVRASLEQRIGDEDFPAGWQGRAWAQEGTKLAQNGLVRATRPVKQAGIVTRTYEFKGGGLLEVELRGEVLGVGKPTLRIVSATGEGIGPDFVLDRAGGVFRAFAPARAERIKIYVLMLDSGMGDCFRLDRLILKRLDPDQHQHRVRASVGEPVLASMASIPSRRDMLADCVNSLLVQCDRVRVFLNNYPDVPGFLTHPRIEVRRSQDWDDRGDAGKVFWLERDRKPGYRLIVDDDLIFPPDFAEVMCAKVAAKEKKAIYATHGVLIRQPLTNYYDDKSRAATFHFGRALAKDHRVHIGATNALCLHSDAVSMQWKDFKYCNSADIWLALHAQEKNLQVLTPARPGNWVRENRHAAPDETIYNHSLNRTRTRFDSSLVQDAVLKFHWPLTVKVGDRPKYGLLVAFGEAAGLGERIEQLMTVSRGESEWIVMLAYDRSRPALEEAVARIKLERETHLVDIAGNWDGAGQTKELMVKLCLDAVLCVDGDALGAGVDGSRLEPGTPERWQDVTVLQLNRAGRKGLAGLILATGTAVPDGFRGVVAGLALPPSGKRLATFTTALRKGRAAGGRPVAKAPTVNSVFKRVKVLNLDRRLDRWESVSRSLASAGIEAERFRAVDGNLAEVAAEYQRYSEWPPWTVSSDVPAIRYQRDLYMGYASQMARVAHVERTGAKAIASRGAWGYLKSYEAVLEEALREGTESLLVLDDDVLLHKDTRTLFAEAFKQLPDDWLILQLGTLQYNWSPPWAEWYSPMLYRTNGSAIGSHAVGMRFDVIPYLLDHVRRFDMPYDIGALSAATRAFADRCFVVSPNLAIQSLVDSDIGTSDFQKGKKREEAAATYRWHIDDYL
jgi:GR25 family glycosyltransferase involved in LPS biosynthesis